eukprot:1005195_1
MTFKYEIVNLTDKFAEIPGRTIIEITADENLGDMPIQILGKLMKLKGKSLKIILDCMQRGICLKIVTHWPTVVLSGPIGKVESITPFDPSAIPHYDTAYGNFPFDMSPPNTLSDDEKAIIDSEGDYNSDGRIVKELSALPTGIRHVLLGANEIYEKLATNRKGQVVSEFNRLVLGGLRTFGLFLADYRDWTTLPAALLADNDVRARVSEIRALGTRCDLDDDDDTPSFVNVLSNLDGWTALKHLEIHVMDNFDEVGMELRFI